MAGTCGQNSTFAMHNSVERHHYHHFMASLRPRILYIAAFAWLAVTGGRFLAPFLEHEAKFSATKIGSVLAAQSAVSSLLGSIGGSWADAREQRFPNLGRAQVMFAGVVLGSTSFLLHGMHLLFPASFVFASTEWHFLLRILWACSSSLVMPTLDGITLAHLAKSPGMDQSDYGRERLYGQCFCMVLSRRPSCLTARANSNSSLFPKPKAPFRGQ